MVTLESIKVALEIPYLGKIEGTWLPDDGERNAAWEMYVELVTRISVVELKPEEGLLREALSSLYTLFGTTRSILRKYGPSIAQPKSSGDLSFGYIAVSILNLVLRPLLAKWHPLLQDYESKRPTDVSPLTYEREWEHYNELRNELENVRLTLIKYSQLLAEVAGVPFLHGERR